MELEACEIDAKLLEDFNALKTSDKDDLINNLRVIIGHDTPVDACQFFLELSGWNLQRAVGAFYDYGFENCAPNTETSSAGCNNSLTKTCKGEGEICSLSSLYNLVVIPSTEVTAEGDNLHVTIQNSGLIRWLEGCYVRSECDPEKAPLATKVDGSLVWLPLCADFRLPLPSVAVGQSVEILVQVSRPNFNSNPGSSVVGAMQFCLPGGETFGEIFYCTATFDPERSNWSFSHGTPEVLDRDIVMREY